MLILMYPDQISAQWDSLYAAIEQALPPHVDTVVDRKANMLQSFLSGEALLWVAIDRETKYGLLVTTDHVDVISGSKNLLIYAIYAFQKVPDEILLICYELLRRYAKKQGYAHIIGFTDNERVFRMVEKLNGNSATRFILMEV